MALTEQPKLYTITLIACDDSTKLTKVMLTNSELVLIQLLVKLAKEKSTSSCMPIMSVHEYNQEEDEED